MAVDPLERARRLAEECQAKRGDLVLVGAMAHRVERASYMLAGWVRTLCGLYAQYSAPEGEPQLSCRRCAKLWRQSPGPTEVPPWDEGMAEDA